MAACVFYQFAKQFENTDFTAIWGKISLNNIKFSTGFGMNGDLSIMLCIDNIECFHIGCFNLYRYDHKKLADLLIMLYNNLTKLCQGEYKISKGKIEVDNIQLTFETINLEQFKIKVINDNNIFEYEYRGDVSKVQKFFNRALFY